jgi:hypothetical protein
LPSRVSGFGFPIGVLGTKQETGNWELETGNAKGGSLIYESRHKKTPLDSGEFGLLAGAGPADDSAIRRLI